ncbi:MAG: putative toxin-antitoxin system toxin component, PIN family [Syntrophales bacterium]
MRAVFDTNVLIAAFLTEGVCAKLLLRARRRDFDLLLCDGILQEFKTVLKKKFVASPQEASAALTLLSEAAVEVHGRIDSIPTVCRDPDDDLILGCARQADADYLVSGDEDLLVLKNHEGIRIVSPREFEKLFPD